MAAPWGGRALFRHPCCHSTIVTGLALCENSLDFTFPQTAFVFFKKTFQFVFSRSQTFLGFLSSSHVQVLIEHRCVVHSGLVARGGRGATQNSTLLGSPCLDAGVRNGDGNMSRVT